MTKPADTVGRSRRGAPAEWLTHRERGSPALLRAMTYVSLRLGRPAGRCLLYFIALYFFLFAPTARRRSRDYLRRALGREPHALDRFRQLLSFASTIHDRLYLINDRFDLFDITVAGEEPMQEVLLAGQGAFLIGAHLGSFEVTRAVGRRQPGLRVAMAMYEENARKIGAIMAAINPAVRTDIIALGSMQAMLSIREYLDRGGFVGILADRTPGGEATQVVNFLGAPARFPIGPMRAAALLRRKVILMLGLYRGANRYHVVFEPLADFSTMLPSEREFAVRAAVARYAAALEKYCRSDPYNWFNFYDFWQS
jgi:predicted LPLAT superfamily acyltransferase